MAPDDGEDGSDETLTVMEPRWPVALAVFTFLVITVVLRVTVPRRESINAHWVVPSIEAVLLVVLLVAHPRGRSGRAAVLLRRLSIALILALVLAALVSTTVLITSLVKGTEVTSSADSLLASGALVWIGNALAFGLLYWQLDSGGPLARHRSEHAHPDFAFSQQMSPELAPPGWRPRYVDYFILGVTTSTAFSPTDVMPMVAWAKLTMALQSLISLSVIGLVIARAVNVFS
ncbi:MAG TPA: hypothetical protein VFB77_14970 [Acidimicrobiales bacterium]|nr:hypothetical protein [Acidimicrobiales bacterium]